MGQERINLKLTVKSDVQRESRLAEAWVVSGVLGKIYDTGKE